MNMITKQLHRSVNSRYRFKTYTFIKNDRLTCNVYSAPDPYGFSDSVLFFWRPNFLIWSLLPVLVSWLVVCGWVPPASRLTAVYLRFSRSVCRVLCDVRVVIWINANNLKSNLQKMANVHIFTEEFSCKRLQMSQRSVHEQTTTKWWRCCAQVLKGSSVWCSRYVLSESSGVCVFFNKWAILHAAHLCNVFNMNINLNEEARKNVIITKKRLKYCSH